MSKYIFYDLETSGRGKKEYPTAFGTTPKWEQIMQIAAIVTDSKFNQTNQNMNEFCRPRSAELIHILICLIKLRVSNYCSNLHYLLPFWSSTKGSWIFFLTSS